MGCEDAVYPYITHDYFIQMALTAHKKRWSRIKHEAGQGHDLIAQLVPST